MPTCFVIQPFDGGAFDKRYEDVFAPAIKAARLEPYRVDRDESSVIPIDDIEKGIRLASVCLAEISTDNPNVWFELGLALAGGKHVELVCTYDRPKFPFDVQHRTITRYKTESTQDFERLRTEITNRLLAALKRAEELETVSQIIPHTRTQGLTPPEIAVLVIVAQNINHSEDGESVYSIRREMSNAGYMPIIVTLALRSLRNKRLIDEIQMQDGNDEFVAYRPTDEGFTWLEANQSTFIQREEEEHPLIADSSDSEEIPF